MTLDVRMGPFENDEREVVPEQTAIFLMLDSPLLTIQVILPYTRSGGSVALSGVQYTEMPSAETTPCQIFKLFADAPVGMC
jgi:hypothetical protein